MATVLRIGNDETVFVGGLTAGGSYLTGATVTYALTVASTGAAVSGGTGSLTYASGSATFSGTTYAGGNYTGTVESTVTSTLTDGAKYYLTITAVSGSYDASWRLECYAGYRGAT